MNDQPVTCRY